MNKERLEYLVNEMYYNYLEQNEAKELIDYIVDLEKRIKNSIEYIENDLQSFLYSIEYKKLLDILKGVK